MRDTTNDNYCFGKPVKAWDKLRKQLEREQAARHSLEQTVLELSVRLTALEARWRK